MGMVCVRVWIASMGVPAAMRPITGTIDRRIVVDRPGRGGTGAAEIAGDDARREGARPGRRLDGRGFRQPQHLDGAGAIGQPLDEAALLQRHDQAMDAGFGAQVERLLHFVEARRHAFGLEPVVDEAQQFALFSGQHRRLRGRRIRSSTRPRRRIGARRKQFANDPYMFFFGSARGGDFTCHRKGHLCVALTEGTFAFRIMHFTNLTDRFS